MYGRLLEPALRATLADTPVAFLAGARQTGKSTLVQALRPGARYATLDDLGTLASAQSDPVGFVESLGPRAILDEVQRAPELFLPIKAAIDRDRRPGRLILTGSADVLTLPRVADNLAGRMEVLTLWPLAQAELAATSPGLVDACFRGEPNTLAVPTLDRAELWSRVLRGGYPEVVARRDSAARNRWFASYLTALVQRDVRDLAAIEGLTQLPRLLQTLATRVGSPLNIADLGRALGMNQMTLRRYLTLLRTLYLTVELPPWFENLGKRLAKASKAYLNDAGILAHLQGLDAESLPDHPTSAGPILENFIALELLKTAAVSKARPLLHHFRTATGQEVDFVLENRRRELVAIEAKASSSIGEADFRGIKVLQDLVGPRLRAGVVLYVGKAALPFGPRLWAMPVQALWSARAA